MTSLNRILRRTFRPKRPLSAKQRRKLQRRAHRKIEKGIRWMSRQPDWSDPPARPGA